MENDQLTTIHDDALASVSGGHLGEFIGSVVGAVVETVDTTVKFVKDVVGTWFGIFG